MIYAAKSPWFCKWFSRHAEKLLAKNFSAVYIYGLEGLNEVASQQPILLVANHSSWWDGIVAIYLSHRLLKLDGYAMMDANNLKRLRFFAKIGGFGIDRQVPGDTHAALDYAETLLAHQGRIVWIFPQGSERPNQERPLHFHRGAANLAFRSPEIKVVPIGLRYEMQHQPQPYAYISVGTPLAYPSSETDYQMQQEFAVIHELDRIARALTNPRRFGFVPILQRKSSLSSWFQNLAQAGLNLLSRRAVRKALPPAPSPSSTDLPANKP